MIMRLDEGVINGAKVSQCVVHDGVIHIAGIMAPEPTGDIEQQTLRVLDIVDNYLARTGSDRRHVLSIQIWLRDMEDFAEMNRVWNAWVDASQPPARACVSGLLAHADARIEVMVMAKVKGQV
ncbi:RidA family protein [Halomonas heilongjiangensis]|nr:RidA family protein [Halomonas heilongjiangensis]